MIEGLGTGNSKIFLPIRLEDVWYENTVGVVLSLVHPC